MKRVTIARNITPPPKDRVLAIEQPGPPGLAGIYPKKSLGPDTADRSEFVFFFVWRLVDVATPPGEEDYAE